MSNLPQLSQAVALGYSLAPLHAATAYCNQLERGSLGSLQTYDRAFSRALNTLNTHWFGSAAQALQGLRQATQEASKLPALAPAMGVADSVLAAQESALHRTARKTVRMAFAY